MGGVLPWIWWAEELSIYRSYEKVFLYGGTHRPHVFIFLLVWVSSFSLLTPFWVWIFADTNPHLYIVFHGGFVGFFLDRKLRLLGKKGCFPESKRVSDFRVKTRCGKPNRKWDLFCVKDISISLSSPEMALVSSSSESSITVFLVKVLSA